MTDAKTQLVQSWLTKAQHDLASARVLSTTNPPILDTAIYHCQQAAEKAVSLPDHLLKQVLTFYKFLFPWTAA
jgi:hypothetical protein